MKSVSAVFIAAICLFFAGCKVEGSKDGPDAVPTAGTDTESGRPIVRTQEKEDPRDRRRTNANTGAHEEVTTDSLLGAFNDSTSRSAAAEVRVNPLLGMTVPQLRDEVATIRQSSPVLSTISTAPIAATEARKIRDKLYDVGEAVKDNHTIDKDDAYEIWDRATQIGLLMEHASQTNATVDHAQISSQTQVFLNEMENIMENVRPR